MIKRINKQLLVFRTAAAGVIRKRRLNVHTVLVTFLLSQQIYSLQKLLSFTLRYSLTFSLLPQTLLFSLYFPKLCYSLSLYSPKLFFTLSTSLSLYSLKYFVTLSLLTQTLCYSLSLSLFFHTFPKSLLISLFFPYSPISFSLDSSKCFVNLSLSRC
ncbi:unnamed protein product [Acanthosepion pharaonis]|uniref:Uncharacterized protein n=1 Tax=Acanthosepion pharaonis TaxID=158019 RepID=A0A812C2P0_ACAPH|nr:unnamed protein product [Sepia pharaonis]